MEKLKTSLLVIAIVLSGLTTATAQKTNKKDDQCQVRGKNDKYDLFLSAGSAGYASLSINSQNRQSVSYSGVIGPVKEK